MTKESIASTQSVGSSAEILKFALLLPVTSRGQGIAVLDSLRDVLESFRETTVADAPLKQNSTKWRFEFFLGVDVGDPVFDPHLANAMDLRSLFKKQLKDLDWELHVYCFQYPEGNICKIWRGLAEKANASGSDFFALLGDDVILETKHWPNIVFAEFTKISISRAVPFGFGCVSFKDHSFPGFPTFPILHRRHFEIFPEGIFPDCFINQDADPFLFQIYRRWNCASLMGSAAVTNRIGGAGLARYKKQHVEWQGQLLQSAVDRIQEWLRQHGLGSKRCITLDVIVPVSRTNREILRRILALPVPESVTTMFILIFDKPACPELMALKSELDFLYADNPMVRLRTNPENFGAGLARNRGLAESSAEWVLFLDDDVIPQNDLLAVYAEAIRRQPHATGFIGSSLLPQPETSTQAAVHIANISYFWTVAADLPEGTCLPWGVTANLVVRHNTADARVRFSEGFPKTGGGEDIDFCLRIHGLHRQQDPCSLGFLSTPEAIVLHPWWDGGKCRYSHFFGWSRGDGLLIDLFRSSLTFVSFPDLAECLLFIGALVAAECVAFLFVPWRSVSNWLFNTALVAGAFILTDLAVEYYYQLFPVGNSHGIRTLKRVPWSIRFVATIKGVNIRTFSQVGRLWGHCERKRLFRNLLMRFNWFGSLWPNYPSIERRRAFVACVLRAGFATAALLLMSHWRIVKILP